MTEERKETNQEKTVDDVVGGYHAVVLRADGELGVESFDTRDELVARIKALVDHDVTVFSFAGIRLNISKPPFRHLLTPWGNLPLFDIPKESLEPDDTGYLGFDPIHLEAPPEIKTPGAQKSSVNTGDFFSDEDDNALNVFDNILPDPDS
ncbi:hypothetical protein EBZ80_18575 [bacterium]|nr:hypothetical protein [Betaproteobacteria bacterium]NDE16930.1 hypothetical protein [bacterium]